MISVSPHSHYQRVDSKRFLVYPAVPSRGTRPSLSSIGEWPLVPAETSYFWQEITQRFLFLLRAAPSAGIITCLALGHLLASPVPAFLSAISIPWLLGILFFLSVILSHLTYELLLPLLKRESAKHVLSDCRKVLGESADALAPSATAVSRWRDRFLESASDVGYAAEIRAHLHIRQGLTYIFGGFLAGPIVVAWLPLVLAGRGRILAIEFAVSLSLALLTLWAHASRSRALGRSIGHAMHTHSTTSATEPPKRTVESSPESR